MDLRHGPDSIWALARDAIFPPSAFDAAPLQVAAILGLAGVTDDVDILDMPCGPGRHALPLARVGHRVVGVDATPSYLDEIRPRIDKDMQLELVEADMRTFARDDAFDLALNLYHSFGYFEDEADDRRVLGNLRRSLRPGGTLVMDLMAAEQLSQDFAPVRERQMEDGSVVREESYIDGTWMWSTWILERDGARHERDMSHRLYTRGALEDALRSAGFSKITGYGGFDGRPLDEDAVRTVLVAR